MQTTIHREAASWAAAAATGGLTETERNAWNDHVATCPACEKLYEEELTMKKLIQEALHPECPDAGFERRMISKFRQAHAAKATKWRELFQPIPVLVGVAACLALMAFVGLGLLIKADRPVVATSGIPAVDFAALPPAVQQTITSNSMGRSVSNVQRTIDNGEVSYDVATTSKDGEEWDLSVAEDGSLLSMDVPPAELPSAVQTALNAQVGKGTLEGVQKLIDDGETTYLAGITSPDDTEHDFTYAEDGTLLSEEVNLNEIPSTLQTAINAQVGQGKLEGIDKTYHDGQITYEATIIVPTGQERNFSISADGELLSREVSLNELPAPVKQTISQTLGQGKVVEIDQSFVAENNVTPYEVEAQKDGKPFDFMIGPTGHFLGTEE